MEIIDAKCPNCGSDIKINRSEKTGTCSHCSSQFLIEDAVKNFITNNYIEHATIVKSDFSDDAVFNEVDKYIALYELDDLNRMSPSILKLKEQFPHKALARIVILHYQFQILLNRTDSVDAFFDEVDEIKKRVKSYRPKSYKDEPPYSKFLWAMNQVEIKYADDIENMLTSAEKERYSGLINDTLVCIEAYNEIYQSNQELEEKYAPFKEKRLKKQKKLEAKDDKKQIKKSVGRFKTKIVSIVCVIFLAFMGFTIFAANYYKLDKPTIRASESNIDTSNLESPIFGENSILDFKNDYAIVNCVKSYSITGRVVGTKKFFPTNHHNKTISAIICLAWGEYSSKEVAKSLDFTYSEEDKTFVASTLDKTVSRELYSTNHLIADFQNEDIKKCLRTIRKYDVVKISGYIVNVTITEKENNIYDYNTSKSLTDNTYEIIYVTDITWIYE